MLAEALRAIKSDLAELRLMHVRLTHELVGLRALLQQSSEIQRNETKSPARERFPEITPEALRFRVLTRVREYAKEFHVPFSATDMNRAFRGTLKRQRVDLEELLRPLLDSGALQSFTTAHGSRYYYCPESVESMDLDPIVIQKLKTEKLSAAVTTIRDKAHEDFLKGQELMHSEAFASPSEYRGEAPEQDAP